MAKMNFNTFSKKLYKTADQMAHKKAVSLTEQFNEPAYILENKDEFFVIRGLVWPYRKNPNPSWREDWPAWAKEDPDKYLVDTVQPVDKLADHYIKAAATLKKMRDSVSNVQYEQNFVLGEIFRDYNDVRLMLSLAQSAAKHLDEILIHVGFAIDDAVRDHKANGQPVKKARD